MPRIPSDAEIDATAIELGQAVDGRCPRHLRSKVAKVIQLADQEMSEAEAAESDVDQLVQAIAGMHRRLAAAEGLSYDAATAITAALAPGLFRITQQKGNRANAHTP